MSVEIRVFLSFGFILSISAFLKFTFLSYTFEINFHFVLKKIHFSDIFVSSDISGK